VCVFTKAVYLVSHRHAWWVKESGITVWANVSFVPPAEPQLGHDDEHTEDRRLRSKVDPRRSNEETNLFQGAVHFAVVQHPQPHDDGVWQCS
jgi:hypothetical protein